MDSYVGRERIDDVALRRYVQKMKNVVFYVAFVLDVLRSSVYVYVSLERGGLHCLDCPFLLLHMRHCTLYKDCMVGTSSYKESDTRYESTSPALSLF
jgi:hypothetical protein